MIQPIPTEFSAEGPYVIEDYNNSTYVPPFRTIEPFLQTLGPGAYDDIVARYTHNCIDVCAKAEERHWGDVTWMFDNGVQKLFNPPEANADPKL